MLKDGIGKVITLEPNHTLQAEAMSALDLTVILYAILMKSMNHCVYMDFNQKIPRSYIPGLQLFSYHKINPFSVCPENAQVVLAAAAFTPR